MIADPSPDLLARAAQVRRRAMVLGQLGDGQRRQAVRAMAADLGLASRVQLRCERVERTGQAVATRGRFDWALARAVARAPVVAEYLVPLLAPQGRALLYRGQWSAADQGELDAALVLLRATTEQCLSRELPGGRGLRHALVVKSLAPCPPSYPRAVGLPAKQPLGAALKPAGGEAGCA